MDCDNVSLVRSRILRKRSTRCASLPSMSRIRTDTTRSPSSWKQEPLPVSWSRSLYFSGVKNASQVADDWKYVAMVLDRWNTKSKHRVCTNTQTSKLWRSKNERWANTFAGSSSGFSALPVWLEPVASSLLHPGAFFLFIMSVKTDVCHQLHISAINNRSIIDIKI